MANAVDITMRVTEQFFDAPAVRRQLSKKRRKALSKQGAFVRRAARSSLRKRKRVAADGMPPSVHSPEPNIRTIFFAWEPATKGVVVGPVRLRTPNNAAQLNEHGGATIVRRGKRRVVMRYKKHPFMGPSLTKATESPRWMGPWEG